MSRDRTILHPVVRAAVERLEAECARQELRIIITDCTRTMAEQQALYAKGRTAPGRIVTNVQYPNSAHNWGVAVDFCQNVRGQEYAEPAFFKSVGTIAKQLGFTWGGDWKGFRDMPHLEWAEFMPNSSVSWLRSTYGDPESFRATWGKYEEEELDMTKDELMSVAGTGDQPSDWAREATEWAKNNGIINGDGMGNYGWQQPITREAFAVILHNFAQKAGI